MQRRDFIRMGLHTACATTATATALMGCGQAALPLQGGFTGLDIVRGHGLREQMGDGPLRAPTETHQTDVIIAGGGIAGLAAARSLRLAGVSDFVLLEQEDQLGGNSRGGSVAGVACPLGAHYLPVPGDDATEVQDLLEELGVRQRVAGRWQYDERHLCHSPQERLFFQGEWQEGLLPMQGVGADTLAQYQRFSQAVAALGAQARFSMPAMKNLRLNRPLALIHQGLDAINFDKWLHQQGFTDPHLYWYLDYCCRDDYGAGAARVSAWAGIHYFASRHGFYVPGHTATTEREGILTWPEGNGWITQRLAAPLQRTGRLRTSTSVLKIAEGRHGVEVDVFDYPSQTVQRWQAQRCIVALPVFIAAWVVQQPPVFLQEAARRLKWAPWLVANIHIDAPLADTTLGAAPAWDNVIYDNGSSPSAAVAGGLGYVNAGHQRLDPRPAPTVLSYYQALGDWPESRAQLARQPWTHWAQAIMETLSVAHPDLRERTTRIEITRYGHAMSIPVPGVQHFLSQIGLSPVRTQAKVLSNGERVTPMPTPATARMAFAHADWSGYSVFEEAFTRGHHAGLAVL